MKKIKSLLVLVILFLSTITLAQEKNTVLWKISGNGLKKPSYLFGTMHLACPDDLKLSEKVSKALSESERLTLELDMDDPTFMQQMQALSVNPGMKNISESLSKEQQEVLDEFFKNNYGAGLTQLGVLKPFVLMSMIVAKGIDCEKPSSIEGVLVDYAKKNQWEVLGVETLAYQVGVFDVVEEKEQLSWLVDYVNDLDKLKKEMKELVEAYQKEDISKLYDLMLQQPEFAKLKEALLDNRNKNWIPIIEKQAAEKSTFFAVGAGHLISEQGLIVLLEKEGYKVEPVME